MFTDAYVMYYRIHKICPRLRLQIIIRPKNDGFTSSKDKVVPFSFSHFEQGIYLFTRLLY